MRLVLVRKKWRNWCSGLEGKVADQRGVIGIGHGWNLELNNLQFRAMEDEIEFPFRSATGMGRLLFGIGADQAGCAEKQFQLPHTPEDVEISGQDHGAVDLADQLVQSFKLILPIAVGEREMHQEDG